MPEEVDLFILPINVADILSSAFVQEMQDSQFRWYFRLLCFAWMNKKKRCHLPNDDEKLRIYAGCRDKKKWGRLKELVLSNFEITSDQKFIFNARLVQEKETILELKQKRADAGKKGADTRWQSHSKAITLDKQKIAPTPTPTPIKANSITLASRPEATQQEVFIDLPLNDNTEFQISMLTVSELGNLYPAVDVPQEFRGMRAWLISNREKRKTRTGVLRFANAWLAKKQNNSGNGTHDKNTDRAGKNNEILARKFEDVDRGDS